MATTATKYRKLSAKKYAIYEAKRKKKRKRDEVQANKHGRQT